MDAIGAQELQLPRAAAPRALRGERPLDRVRRQHLPAQGPQGRRLPARPHARGDVHPRGEGPLLVLQGPAALDLPDPDQVPRRGAAPRRPAARPRVRHEGLLLLRHRRRRPRRELPAAPRRLHPDLRPARLRLRHRHAPLRRHGRLASRRSSSPRPRSARTPTSAAPNCDYAANVEAVAGPPAPRPCRTTTRRPRTPRRRPTPRPSRRWSTTSTTPFPRDDRAWAAATRSRTCCVVLEHPDGTREPLAIGAARRPRGRPEAARGASSSRPRSSPSDEADFAQHPALVKGYIGPGVLGEKSESGIRYLVDPRVVEGTRWVTGADVDGRHVIDLVAGRDFTPDGTIEAAEVRDGDPCPRLRRRHPRDRARHRDGPHLPARPQVRRRAGPPGARRERQARHGHDGLLRHRPVARRRRDRRGHPRRARPRAGRATSRPSDVHLVATGKDEEVFAAAERIAHELSAQGIAVLYDDRPGKVSPGVKFKDAELHRRARRSWSSAAAWPTAPSRSRTGPPASARTSPADHVVDHLVRLVRA